MRSKEGETNMLKALDPNLPLLASQAAIELDCFIREGKPSGDLSATRRLAQLLSRSFDKDQAGSQSLLDPTTQRLMSRALDATDLGEPTTVIELAERAWSIANKLLEPTRDDPESLQQMRAFCAALSECASAHLQAVYSRRPSHEYRRLGMMN